MIENTYSFHSQEDTQDNKITNISSYDDSGNKIRLLNYYGKQINKMSETLYNYEDGKLYVETNNYYGENGDKQYAKYEYDKNGNLISKKQVYPELNSSITTKYKYANQLLSEIEEESILTGFYKNYSNKSVQTNFYNKNNYVDSIISKGIYVNGHIGVEKQYFNENQLLIKKIVKI